MARLWRDSWLSTGLAIASAQRIDEYRQRLALDGRNWDIWLAMLADETAGFVAIQRDQTWVRQLFVGPAYQGAGVGTALLGLGRRELPTGWLRTDLGNGRARSFYERRGLRRTTDQVHPEHGHVMATYAWP